MSIIRKWRGLVPKRFSGNIKRICPCIISLLLFAAANLAIALPQSGQVTAGTGSIAQNGSVMNINQATNQLAINWQNFNIASNEQVIFNQPTAASVALNRVLGLDPSSIFGQLTANGRVILINPSGILFAPGARVDAGSIIATTMNITDSDFLANNYKFTSDGTNGSIVNNGLINAADGGCVILAGTNVSNDGSIIANGGTAALLAGSGMTFDLTGQGKIAVQVDSSAVKAEIDNKGIVQADGGKVYMSVKSADALLDTVLNQSGIVKAQSIDSCTGEIILDGGSSGSVANSGTIDASGKESGQTGGIAKVLGDNIALSGTSSVDVSGDLGGGTALIGGNWQGKGTETNASQTSVEKGAIVNASAITNGDGGKAVVWSNDYTDFSGSIFAQGGSQGGNGGQTEVSADKVSFDGTVNTLAPLGQVGTFLLDPADIYIGATEPDGYTGTFMPSSYINNILASSALNIFSNNDLTVAGNISGSNSLELNVEKSVYVNGNITITGSGNVANFFADVYGDNIGTSELVFGEGAGVSADTVNISNTGGNVVLGNITAKKSTITSYGNITQNNTSSIVNNGNATFGGFSFEADNDGDITLNNSTNVLSSADSPLAISANSVDIWNSQPTELGNITANDLSLISYGAITQSSDSIISVTGNAEFYVYEPSEGTDCSLKLNNSGNDFNTFHAESNDISVTDKNSIDLEYCSTHKISVNAGGDISFDYLTSTLDEDTYEQGSLSLNAPNGSIIATDSDGLGLGIGGANATLTAGKDISLDNVVILPISNSNSSEEHPNGLHVGASLTANAAGNISIAGTTGLDSYGSTTLTAGGNISLDKMSIGGRYNSGDSDASDGLFPDYQQGSLTATAGGSILFPTDEWMTVKYGSATLNSTNAISLPTILLGNIVDSTNNSGQLSVTANGISQNTGTNIAALNSSTATFNAGSGDITLTSDSNDFQTISLTGHNANVYDIYGIDLGNTTVNDMTVNTSGNIWQTSDTSINSTGTTSLTTDGDIDVDEDDNDFNTISLNGADTYVSDCNSLIFGDCTVNSIHAYLGEGNTTQTGILNISNLAKFYGDSPDSDGNATASIDLTNVNNDFGGDVRFTNIKNASIVDKNDLSLGNIIIDGDLNATAKTGTITVDGCIGYTNLKLQIDANAGKGNATLNADNVVISDNGSISEDSGITIQPVTDGTAITLGTGTDGLHLSDDDLSKMTTSGNLQIGSSKAGSITVDSSIDQSDKKIILATNGDIDVNSSVNAAFLTLQGSSADNNFNVNITNNDGAITVHGDGGDDTLSVSDNYSGETGIGYTITDATEDSAAKLSRLQGNSYPAVDTTFDGIENLKLATAPGASNVNDVYLTGIAQDLTGSEGILYFDACDTSLSASTSPVPSTDTYGSVVYRDFRQFVPSNVKATNNTQYEASVSTAQRAALSSIIVPTTNPAQIGMSLSGPATNPQGSASSLSAPAGAVGSAASAQPSPSAATTQSLDGLATLTGSGIRMPDTTVATESGAQNDDRNHDQAH